MKKAFSRFLFVVFLFSFSACFADEMLLSIRYLGLPVVRVTITDNDSILTISAQATTIGSIAARMNNTYISNYTADYLSISYRKIIQQKDYTEDRIIYYDRENLVAKRTSYLREDISKDYVIKEFSRDFFSALFYLRRILNNPQGEFWLDANSLIWKASYKIIEEEMINTTLGKINTIKVKIDFENVDKREKERSDMLTNNLVSEEQSLYLWFTNDEKHLPVKAKFAMKPFPVFWILDDYRE